ncbi:hypothetical protein D9615_005307 [Tricholomella constricta]|uniref:Uncharacterized protein n=1 Tax=Tricholomella constricta TaxID=117010 RepID=A0A8H5M1K2_9AGAR|nr:hypothetical protein D9615_005307 [Tricholomella constricta]
MAATTSTRAPPPSRRPLSASPTPPSIAARGPAARSAASSRVASSLNSASVTRRASSKAAPPPSATGDIHETLSASLKQETDQKEQLLVQVQNKDQTIASLTTENNTLTSALNAAETRLNELYAEQSRSEIELAQRIDISEKLRAQVRELEKEKRDIQRRYNEQTTTFEAERQAFYDNEQHLKSRIQSLTQARKQPEPIFAPAESDIEPDGDDEIEHPSVEKQTPRQDVNDPETEPAEMTSLRLELSTLSTSYSSLQSTLVLLQTQLVDLKRVNHELQEENESYMILLREKTLSGQFDLMRQVGGGSSSDGEDDDDDYTENTDVGSLRSTTRSTLDRVEEEISEESLEHELERSLETRSIDSPSRQPSRNGRKRTISSSGVPRGESLADLPITGPGLDLAAELGRAENKDILDGNAIEEPDRSVLNGKGKRVKKGSDGRKVSSNSLGGLEPSGSINDIDALRTEVKSLKDANKALSLYASKIIDRIISQEGFEHVLAVDYDKEPLTAGPHSNGPKSLLATNPKARPQSVIVGRSSSSPMPETRVNSPPTLNQPNPKAQRRSLSFDWKGFSLFNNTTEKKPDPNLRPLTLKPGASPVTGGRKLDTQEDEEDRKERERLNATMKLMGIQPPATQLSPAFTFPTAPIQRASSTGTTGTPLTATNNRRFSWFGSKTAENSDASSVKSTASLEGSTNSRVGLGIPNLTQEALEQAEAENSLAVLDAHERNLSAEIARGASSGFTEISPRAGGRRSRRSAGGSTSSTVWSAGMSGGGDDD